MKRDELSEILDEKLAKLVGQLTRHVDERIDSRISQLEANMTDRFNRLETMVDTIAERVVTDEQERAAIVMEQNRHRAWIGQLAESANTKLAPPLPE